MTRNPHPLVAVESLHRRQAERLAKRQDRFSQLLSTVIRDEHRGQLLLTQGGLTPEEFEELHGLRPEAHLVFRAELQGAIERLRQLLALGDPLYIVAIVQSLNMFIPWGEYYEPTHEGSEAKVELVAGLLATQPPAKTGQNPSPSEMQAVLDELDHIVEANLLFNLTKPVDGDLATAGLQFASAMHWMSIRGTSFAGQGRELAQEIYRPHDQWLLSNLGFTIDDVIDAGDAVYRKTNNRLNDLGREGEVAGNEVVARRGGDVDRAVMAEAATAVIGVFDGGIRRAVTFTLDELLAFAPALDEARIRALLAELSIELGSMQPGHYTGLFDENPLRERPFLRLDDTFVLPIPGMLERDVDQLLEHRLLERHPTFSRQRAKTLDRLAVRYLATALPGAATYTNLFYEGAELDGLVLFDDIALLVEGKGGDLSIAARRGDVRRLERDIGDIVEVAWRQGARARDYLLRDGDTSFFDEAGREIVRIPAGTVREVHVVNPTLHELAGHTLQLGRLRALGLFPDDAMPWSVYINDLRVIAETADNAAVFLHYLVWRNRLPLGNGIRVADEIDLWASYLLGERFGMLHEEGVVSVANSSTDFDAYYDGLAGRGPESRRPGKFLEEPVTSFVARMANERPSGWRQAAGACLDLSIPELAAVAARAQEVAQLAQAEGTAVAFDIGRVALIGLQPLADPRAIVRDFEPDNADPTIIIACRNTSNEGVKIVWAGYRKPITFELSAFERQFIESDIASPFAP